MAKLSDVDKELILADYHTGKYSQRELAKKHNVSLGTINNLTKGIEPKNEHLVNAQVSILSAKSELSMNEMNAVMNTAQEMAFNKGLVYSIQQKALKKANAILDSIDSPADLKTIIDGVDKASLTLGVNQRHANTMINNTNAQQNNENTVIEFKRL